MAHISGVGQVSQQQAVPLHSWQAAPQDCQNRICSIAHGPGVSPLAKLPQLESQPQLRQRHSRTLLSREVAAHFARLDPGIAERGQLAPLARRAMQRSGLLSGWLSGRETHAFCRCTARTPVSRATPHARAGERMQSSPPLRPLPLSR